MGDRRTMRLGSSWCPARGTILLALVRLALIYRSRTQEPASRVLISETNPIYSPSRCCNLQTEDQAEESAWRWSSGDVASRVARVDPFAPFANALHQPIIRQMMALHPSHEPVAEWLSPDAHHVIFECKESRREESWQTYNLFDITS